MQAIKDFVFMLKQNATVQQYVGSRFYLEETSNITNDCIVYKPSILLDDGIKEVWRVQVDIITADPERGLSIDQACRNTIATIGDPPLTSVILQAEVNGGGHLFNYENNRHYQTSYYEILARK